MTTSTGRGLPFRIRIDVKVPMRDGVRLSADIYLPFGDGPFPTLLLRTPYNNQNERLVHSWVPYFIKHGYAVVMQDSRGRHDSDGEWYAYRDEPKDGYDTQQWVGQQPWCDGNIGTFGHSYPGFTQVMSAPLHSPYLKALVPSDSQESNYGGHAYIEGPFFMPWGQWFIGNAGHTAQSGSRSMIDGDKLFWRLPLISAFDDIVDSPAYHDAVRHYTYDELWKSYDVKNKYDQIDAPAYFLTGWYDHQVHETFKLYHGWKTKARSAEARRVTRILVGPWTHGTLGEARLPGDIAVGQGGGVDILKEHVRWYDRRLKGIDNGFDDEPPLKLFIMGDNEWRNEHEWPLARTRYTNYYLHSEGRANSLHGDGDLSLAPSPGEAYDGYAYDPAHPTPTMGGTALIREVCGAFDRRAVERRDDVLVYSSEVLTQDVEVTGPSTVTLYASSSAPDTDFNATLVDVHPDGKAINISEGVVRTRFRDSFERPTLIEPGRIYQYKIVMYETSNVFKPGHRIRLEISSSNFPRFDRNLNTGHQPGLDAEMRVADQAVYHDAAHPSHITLPIIPRG